MKRLWSLTGLASLLLLGSQGAANAQAPAIWTRTVEANANLLFGAAEGRVGALTGALGHADSTLEFRFEARYSYADAPDDHGDPRVTARASRLSMGVDHRPFARFSPFAFGSAEANLQQRIASRYAAGGGAKLLLSPPGDNEANVSLALLWEHTRALHPEPDQDPSITLARWSLRVRASRRLTSGLQLSHQTLWQPAAKELSQYTTETTTALAATLNASLSLTVTLRDRYDSESITRGATSNHDGQLLFGVRAKF